MEYTIEKGKTLQHTTANAKKALRGNKQVPVKDFVQTLFQSEEELVEFFSKYGIILTIE
jgi:hypothetical protein